MTLLLFLHSFSSYKQQPHPALFAPDGAFCCCFAKHFFFAVMEQSLLVRMVGQTLQKRKDNAVQIVGAMKRIVRLLHLVSVDHLLDHHTADRTSLSCSQVAVIALLQVYTNFVGRFNLKPFHCFFALLCEFALHIKNTFLILECCSSRVSAGLCAAFSSQ